MAAVALIVASTLGYSASPHRGDTVLYEEYVSQEPPYLGPDYGAEFDFASTKLVGRTINYEFGKNVRQAQPEWVCAPLKAAVVKHGYWFADGPTSQQNMQRKFMDDIPTVLCKNATEQSEEEYLTKLHGMLKNTRASINQHVHSAFWIKEVCNILDDPCFDASDLYTSYNSDLRASDNCPTKWAAAVTCMTVMLAHEKYNLAEGYHFLNVSYGMLLTGKDFCLDPNFEQSYTQLTSGMEEHMAYHRSNVAFEELADSHFELLCTEPGSKEDYDAAYNAMSDYLDKDLDGEQTCLLDEEVAKLMPFLKNNPPEPEDLIHIMEANFWLVVAAGVEMVTDLLSDGKMCLSDDGNEDAARSQALLEKVLASGLPNAAYHALGLSDPDGSASPRTSYHSMPTIYHKIAPACFVHMDNSTTYSNVCIDEATGDFHMDCTEGSITHNVPVFDIATSTDITKCSGEMCKAAARAVLSYQEMLGPITHMRWDMHQATHGVPSDVDFKTLNQTTWTVQRSCAAFSNILDNAQRTARTLPKVIGDLKSAQNQLSATCISPPRVWPFEFNQSFVYTAMDTCLDKTEDNLFPELRLARASRIAGNPDLDFGLKDPNA